MVGIAVCAIKADSNSMSSFSDTVYSTMGLNLFLVSLPLMNFRLYGKSAAATFSANVSSGFY